MAKKKSHRKHQFKHTAPAAHVAEKPTDLGPSIKPAAAPKLNTLKGSSTLEAEFGPGLSFVRHDLRKVGVLAAGFIAVELVLWYLLNHTGLGPAVYQLVKL